MGPPVKNTVDEARDPSDLHAANVQYVRIVSMPHCPRCAGDHRDLVATAFRLAAAEGFNTWLLCPKTSEPIMVAVELPDNPRAIVTIKRTR